MTEIWKAIKGWEKVYEVSNQGKVRSLLHHRWKAPLTVPGELKGGVTKQGYRKVILAGFGKRETRTVHRLVALAFLGKPKKGYETNHKDGNRLNNAVENLEWVTRSQNKRHSLFVLGTAPNSAKFLPIDFILELRQKGYSASRISRESVELLGRQISQATLSKVFRGQHFQQLTG